MPNKQKATAEEKTRVTQECLAGRMTRSEAASLLQVNRTTIGEWIYQYESEGSSAFFRVNAIVDRGFQYTNRRFHHKLETQGMTQSMSRTAHFIDNGHMEGFCDILKREMYYGRRFTSQRELMRSIEAYIYYYNHKRVQRNLGILTSIEKHTLYLAA